ncbi:MAG: energy transducer TonB [Muribaculaceae bacterium]|jgi:protein TonB|nr:energy transducer TonB [Muribaculaceae bacterium]
MAKDVDLSSKEWRDIVFENKNKDFGAYILRAGSVQRHTKALIITVVILAALLVVGILATAGILFNKAEEDINAGIGQEEMTFSTQNNAEDELEEEEEQIQEIIEEEPEEAVIEEEEVAQQAFTEVEVKNDDEVKNEVKDQSEMKEDKSAIGTQNIEGNADIRAAATVEVREKVVVEEKPKEDDHKVYSLANVEQKPTFPGGDAAMFKWLGEHINYPAAAAEEGASGKVQVQFVVSKTGKVTNVTVVRGKHPALDKEAIRVVSAMPNWTPGRQNGQPVNVTYILPVNFTLK